MSLRSSIKVKKSGARASDTTPPRYNWCWGVAFFLMALYTFGII